MKFSKKDFLAAIVTGLTAGFVGWRVLVFIDKSFGFNPIWLIVIIPILWILGINLGYFLGRWFAFFNQFGKYAVIGFTNFAVDAGFLNLFIYLTEFNSGLGFAVLKGFSFVIASTHSFFWNRYWAFGSNNQNTGSEAMKFSTVSVMSLIINVFTAFTIVTYITPFGGIDVKVWANIASITGSAVALIFSFVGFKIFVFKK